MFVKPEFISETEEKKHNLNNHTLWYKEKIKFNHLAEIKNAWTKRAIYYVNYWINIWSEINGVRPSIIYKSSKSSYGEDTIVIPLTSDKIWKSIDSFDVEILPDSDNGLKVLSHVKIRQIRCVSKKRIETYVGKIINEEVKNTIQSKLISMFGMKIK